MSDWNEAIQKMLGSDPCNSASPPAAPGMPNEEEIVCEVGEAIDTGTIDAAKLAARRILDLIRPAFEAKEMEADRAIQRAIMAESARDALLFDVKTEQGRALLAMEDRALSAEAKLAKAVEGQQAVARESMLMFVGELASRGVAESLICEAMEAAAGRSDTLVAVVRRHQARSASAAARGETD